MKLKNVFDVTVCSNPQFILYVIGFFLLQSGHITPPAYLPDRALDLGFSKYQAATLVSAMGVTNTLCRALGGLLGDGTPVRRQILFASCLLIAGLCTLVSVALTTFWQLIVYSALFGLFKGNKNITYVLHHSIYKTSDIVLFQQTTYIIFVCYLNKKHQYLKN